MFETISRLYREEKLSKSGVEAAVSKGWITQEQAEQIFKEDSI